ncbi:MAG: sugar phosphate isomerase/epimerase [Clostridiales bacterium]|nr:sugar phosphate isomerase/epimerase [Clostridiales bacterium]
MKYGIQLYSVRDLAAADFEAAVRTVAEQGYAYIEYAGFFGRSAEEVAALQEKYGISCIGTHSPWTDLRPSAIADTIRYHKTIGSKNYTVPGADLKSLEKIEDFCAVMNFAQPILDAEGIRLGYHNHSHEFRVMPWGSTIHSEIERRTKVDFEIDTFWAFNAGCDPLAVVDRLKDRIRLIHIKDGFYGGKGMPLGDGEAPVKDVRRQAIEKGIVMIVESETLKPDGPDEARRCIEFLKACDAEDGN